MLFANIPVVLIRRPEPPEDRSRHELLRSSDIKRLLKPAAHKSVTVYSSRSARRGKPTAPSVASRKNGGHVATVLSSGAVPSVDSVRRSCRGVHCRRVRQCAVGGGRPALAVGCRSF